MKTAHKVMLATWFRPSKVWPLLKTAKRTSIAGDARRYEFEDGSAIKTIKGRCQVAD